MKTFTKILLISGGALLILGFGITVIGATIGGGINGTIINGNMEKYEEVDYDFTEDINNIDIKETFQDITIGRSSDSDTHIVVFDSEHHKHNVSVNGDTLNISVDEKAKKKQWYEYISIGYVNTNPITMQILLPENEYENLNINASSSDLLVNSNFVFSNASIKLSSGDVEFYSNVTGNTDIKTNSGEITADDLDSEYISIESSSGEITLSNIDGGKLQAEASSGTISISDSVITEDIRVKTSSGEIKLVNVKADKLDSVSSSGDVYFSDLELTSDSSIKTSSGDVDGVDSMFLVITQTSSGDTDIEQVKDGTVLNITTSSGDISVR